MPNSSRVREALRDKQITGNRSGSDGKQRLCADPKLFSTRLGKRKIVVSRNRSSIPLFLRQDVFAIETALVFVVVVAGCAGEAGAPSVNPRVAPPTCAVVVHEGDYLALDVDLSKGPILHDLAMDRWRP